MDNTWFWIIAAAVFAVICTRGPRDRCPSCGSKNPRIARFCRKCGKGIRGDRA